MSEKVDVYVALGGDNVHADDLKGAECDVSVFVVTSNSWSQLHV